MTILYAVPPHISATKLSFHQNAVEIGQGAFYGCRLTWAIVIPDKIEVIGSSAFATSLMKNIALSDNIRSIGTAAFSATYVTNFRLPSRLTRVPSALLSYSSVQEVTLHDTVTHIGSNAFGNTPLVRINFPKQLEEIGANAFFMTYIDGQGLELCANLRFIGSSAFESCTEITSIIIPESVIQIADMAFYMCGNLKLWNCDWETGILRSQEHIPAYVSHACFYYRTSCRTPQKAHAIAVAITHEHQRI